MPVFGDLLRFKAALQFGHLPNVLLSGLMGSD